MSEEKFGTKNLEKIHDLVYEGMNVGFAMKAEKSGLAARLGKLMMLMDETVALTTVKWDMLDDEYLDFSSAEMESEKERFKSKFNIADDKIEKVIEDVHDMTLDLTKIIARGVKLAEFLKQPEKTVEA